MRTYSFQSLPLVPVMPEPTGSSSEELDSVEVKLSTTQLPSIVIELIRRIRSVHPCSIPTAYMKYVVPDLERKWQTIVSEEAERMRKNDPAFANDLHGENGGA